MGLVERLLSGILVRARRLKLRLHRVVVLVWLSRGAKTGWIFGRGILHPKPTFSNWPLPSAVSAIQLEPCVAELEIASELFPDDVESKAQRCFSQNGIWPISFSYPSTCEASPMQKREQLISAIVPGLPYGYEFENEYRAEYERSYYAVTHKKGGWDCFRHLEIFQAGALPLMPDASEIPEYSMVHYPRQLLKSIAKESRECLPVPSSAVRQMARHFFNQHLTTQAMSEYIASRFSVDPPNSVLFIDTYGRWNLDYLSAMTYIGFEQLTRGRLSAFISLPFLYQGWGGNQLDLYGRGFGYTRTLKNGTSQRLVRLTALIDQLRNRDFDLVVFGSIIRDWELFLYLLPHLDRQTTALIVGEDVPSPEKVMDELRSTRCQVFVRAIE